MEWLSEAKELYSKRKYENCLSLLYNNSNATKKYVWCLLILSFLLTILTVAVVAIKGTIVTGAVVGIIIGLVITVALGIEVIQKYICRKVIEKEEKLNG